MSNYVQITYDEFKSFMVGMKFTEIVVEGSFERTWSFEIKNTPYEIRIFSSVNVGIEVTRSNGKDAIRCLIWNKENNKIVMSSPRIHRTMSALPNVRKRCRKLWLHVKHNKCTCGGLMIEKTAKKTNHKFLGCSNYPVCTKTKNIDKPEKDQLKLRLICKKSK